MTFNIISDIAVYPDTAPH